MKVKTTAVKDGQLNLNYGKFANQSHLVDQLPKVSFPIEWSELAPDTKYIQILFIDYDAIPVSGAPFIHWSVANIPVAEFNNGIPENFALDYAGKYAQGINTMVRQNPNDETAKFKATCFIGAMPPNTKHQYTLLVWGTTEPLKLKNHFWVSDMIREINEYETTHDSVDFGKLLMWYPSHQ